MCVRGKKTDISVVESLSQIGNMFNVVLILKEKERESDRETGTYKERKRSLTRNNDRKIQEERYELKDRQ